MGTTTMPAIAIAITATVITTTTTNCGSYGTSSTSRRANTIQHCIHVAAERSSIRSTKKNPAHTSR